MEETRVDCGSTACRCDGDMGSLVDSVRADIIAAPALVHCDEGRNRARRIATGIVWSVGLPTREVIEQTQRRRHDFTIRIGEIADHAEMVAIANEQWAVCLRQVTCWPAFPQ